MIGRVTQLSREASGGGDSSGGSDSGSTHGDSSGGGTRDKIFIPGVPRGRNGGKRPARKKDLLRGLNVRAYVGRGVYVYGLSLYQPAAALLALTYPRHTHAHDQSDSDASSDGDGCYTSSSEDEFGGSYGVTKGIVRIRWVGCYVWTHGCALVHP